jgi:hypothetical protein
MIGEERIRRKQSRPNENATPTTIWLRSTAPLAFAPTIMAGSVSLMNTERTWRGVAWHFVVSLL